MRMLFSLALQAVVPIAAFALQAPSPARAPSAYDVLLAEHTRGPDTRVLDAAIASSDTVLQRLAARAYGRWEQAEFLPKLRPLLASPSVSVRREAVNAIAQIGAPFDFASLLGRETNGAVRGAIFETMGRAPRPRPGAQPAAPSAFEVVTLTRGLVEADPAARAGAARGFESLMRRNTRVARPTPESLTAIRQAFRANESAEMRQLLLLALTAAMDRDSATLAIALRDTSAQVRRVAVALSRQWLDDPSYLVRYQALRAAGTCERAVTALRDDNQHVVLAAVDLLGERKCPAPLIDSLVRNASWRVQAHAIVALAKVDSAKAVSALPRVANSAVWQARAWAAQAAKTLKAKVILAKLARDANPNVAIAALTTDADAVRALRATHSGLVLAGANHFRNHPNLRANAPALATALMRLSAAKVPTNRDPRIALLQRLNEGGDSATVLRLTPLVRDVDPEVAVLAAKVIGDRAHVPILAETKRYQPAPFPTEAGLQALHGATASIKLKGLGALEIALLPDEAPATVATFVQLAESKAFNGLTWHRVVPNFVLQGGSPGADEYDAITKTFMRDEVGFARHERGTFGISTRGRDTGDGQLFINLVDNFRLDHDYTVFATMLKGLDVMDRVQEGDVIESITITRKR